MPVDTVDLSARAGRPDEPGGGSVLDQLLTARQLAELMQMPPSTIEDYARRGLLPSLKLGRHRRFVRSQVEQTVTSLLTGVGPPRREGPPRRAR